MFVSAAWLAPAILAVFEAYVEARLGNRPPVSARVLVWEGSDWLLYALWTPLVFALARRLPLERGTLAVRLPIHFVAAVTICAGWAAAGNLLRWLLLGWPATRAIASFPAWFLTSLPFGVAVYFAVVGIEHGTSYLTQASRLSAQLADARLQALRAQLQPHFLFNSLNAMMVVLRDRNVRTAQLMVEQLADVLQHVMRHDRPQEIPLREEIAFLQHYLSLEQIRFSDRLHPVFELDPGVMNARVPDLILQPIVENALRHGLDRRMGATLLHIAARRDGSQLVLSVTDDGPGLVEEAPSPPPPPRAGVGLSNTRERLATLYGDRGTLSLTQTPGGGAVATIRIPYAEAESHVTHG